MIALGDFTPQQYAVLFNGCGAKVGWRRFIRPPQGHARVHCDQHDLDCLIGGDRLAELRAARKMLRGMLGDATGMRWWQRPGFRAKAVLYYAGLRLLGAGFHRGQPRDLAMIRALADRRIAQQRGQRVAA